jgi:hypothetical protein
MPYVKKISTKVSIRPIAERLTGENREPTLLRSHVMIKINRGLGLATERDLERVIEPLASFICATDRPRAALISALAMLCSEVEQTNRAALSHFATVSENR